MTRTLFNSRTPLIGGFLSALGVLALAIAGCVTFPVIPTTQSSPHSQPIVFDESKRTLFVFAPGSRIGKAQYFAALDRLGIEYEVGLQINAYLPKKEHTPDRISLDRINARRSFTKAEAEWNPKPPAIAYYDYEPDRGAWNWDVQQRGYGAADLRFFNRAVADLRAYQIENGNTLPLGFYGQPVTRRDKPWTEQDKQKIINNKPLIDGFDWIVLSIYARGAIVNDRTEAQHRRKIRNTWEVMQEVYPDRPVIPMLSLKEVSDDDEYGRVYFDELNKMGISTLALWSNPDSTADTRMWIKQLEKNAEYIRAWQRGDD